MNNKLLNKYEELLIRKAINGMIYIGKKTEIVGLLEITPIRKPAERK